ncbi:regulator of g protein signaling [Anaeramoeba flamelloides]|uniref:Regulator of g protein signaling n=1 Tax=Anaeramoeba flamelloides TaxID=1746091 RepID=A0ABQ8X0J4_9EUKA|nr:regulator of g protein signaling [Anaeramoeba flamelloides]
MGNFKPRIKIKNRKKGSYLKNLSKGSAAIAIVGIDGKFLFANQECKKYFGFSGLDAEKKTIGDLRPTSQSHVGMNNLVYASHEIKIANQLNKKQKRTFIWFFTPYDQKIQTQLQLTLIEIGGKLAVQVLIKPEQKVPQAKKSISTDSIFQKKNSQGLGTTLGGIQLVNHQIDNTNKKNPKKGELNSILNRIGGSISTDRLNIANTNKEIILNESKRIRMLKKENDDMNTIYFELIRKRNSSLEKLEFLTKKQLNQEISESSSAFIEEKYDEEINEAVRKIQPFQVLINNKSLMNLTTENYFDALIETIELESVSEWQNALVDRILLHTDLLKIKIEFVEQQIKRINLNISFLEVKQRITDFNQNIQQFSKQSSQDLIELGNNLIRSVTNQEESQTEQKSIMDVFKQFDITIDLNLIPFYKLVSKKKYSIFFMNFLKSQYNEENLLFYNQVSIFKQLKKSEELNEKAEEIFNNFIKSGAKMQININGNTRGGIKTRIESNNISSDLFNEAQNQIYLLMLNDPYTRFLDSPYYEELKKTNPTFKW